MVEMFRTSSKIVFAICVLTLAGRSPAAYAYTPESPEVKALVARGMAYIEQNHGKHALDKELGGYAVCAMAAFSYTGDENHPLVKAAIDEIRKGVQQGFPNNSHANYSLGLALILLGTVDAARYPGEVQALLDEIYKRQLPNGTWTYPNERIGDTSQSQYACLGMWMAHRQGIQVRIPAVANVTNWFLRTQAPDGGFGYRPEDPGSFTRITPERMTPSMGVAGAGSLYVLGELLGFIDDPKTMRARSLLPPAIQPVIEKQEAVSNAVEQGRWQLAVKDADAWCARNAGVQNPFHQYYYMYTVERYWAFRELAVARPEAEPAWYNQGVAYLQKNITKDGSWTSDNGPTIGTAFAVLYLLRSSKKTVERIQLEQGRLTGGRGLKADMSTAKTNAKGQVVTSDGTKEVADILEMLDDPKAPQAEYVSDVPEKLVLSSDPEEREKQISRLRRMIINGSFQGRLTAAKTLGTVRDLGSAPALIFALSDPDGRVVRAARDSLRFMSRKPAGFGFDIPNTDGTPPEKAAREKAQADWTNWLLSVRPDAELIE